MSPTFSRSSKNDSPVRARARFRPNRAWVFITLWVLLGGCASVPPPPWDILPETAPARTLIPSVPFYAQKAYQCGPAAMAIALGWSGLDVTPDDLAPAVYTPDRKGSLQADLIGAARRSGRLPYPVAGMECLLREIAAGHPVIVLQNLGLRWFPRWHYAVAIGYDRPAGQIILHSGVVANRRVGFATFQRTWQRADQWGLVVVPPREMPACAEEQPYLEAGLALQQSGRAAAAESAFAAAARRWPQSFGAWMALGNLQYARGDSDAALQAFENATRIDPTDGAAYNNLAHVLAGLGRWDQAETAAARAVALGGRHIDLFRQTLEEIRRNRR